MTGGLKGGTGNYRGVNIAPGKSEEFIASKSISTPGTHKIEITVDPLNYIDELNETNNVSIFNVDMPVIKLPDLIVESAEIKIMDFQGVMKNVIAVKVKNIGEGGYYYTDSSVPKFLIWKDSVKGESKFIGNYMLADIAPGQSREYTIDNTGSDIGSQKISVIVDPDNIIAESNNDNNIYNIAETTAITVTSPNGGEQWQIGKAQYITWNMIGVDKVKLILLWNEVDGRPSSLDIATIDYSSPTDSAGNPYVKPANNQYTYGWYVPENQTLRTNYRIQVSDASKQYATHAGVDFDVSDNYFSIANNPYIAPAVEVTSPNGGEQLIFGNTAKITWKRNWMPSQANGLVTVAIKKGDANPVILAQGVPDANGYSLTVSTSSFIHGYDYKIIVTSNGFGSKLSDESDNYFSISSSQSSNWDVSVKFDKVSAGSFYPFSGSNGAVGTTYYKTLNDTDNLYSDLPYNATCPAYWTQEPFARRSNGWYAERKMITDSKYRLLIRGIAPADCGSEAGYIKGELNLNPGTDWQITDVVKCNVQNSNKGQETYCKTESKIVKFAAGSDCGGCCACSDSGNVDIEVIAERKSAPAVNKITVSSPDGGEKWVRGNSYDIAWSTYGADKINIGAFAGGKDLGAIALGVDASKGKFSWAIPKDFGLGFTDSDIISAKIRVENSANPSIYDDSDNFSIVSTPASCILPDGTLVKLPGDPKIYIIRGCIKYWIQTPEEFTRSGYKWSDVTEYPSSAVGSIPDTSAANPAANNIPEGSIIQASGDPDVYIVKYAGNKAYKRLILSPSVFRSYGHLKWENIIKVDKATLNSFMTSNLVRSENGRIYKLVPSGDTGLRNHIKDMIAFQRLAFDLDAVYQINATDENSYITGQELE